MERRSHSLAVTRGVPRSMDTCELTHVAREPLDVEVARRQHAAYGRALEQCGCEVLHLPALDAYPDSVFVEDVALALDEAVVLTRPGVTSRMGEVAEMRAALDDRYPLRALTPPATLDGGDVLRLGRTLWVGRSARTNAAGVTQLEALVAPLGYEVREARLSDALHLKTAVTQVGPGLLLVNPSWVDARQFGGWEVVEVAPAESFAANAVWVNGRVIHSTQFPRTQERLRARGVDIVEVDASELAKAEGGVTCCSLLVPSVLREVADTRMMRA